MASGQLLNHVNLGEYLASKISSLKQLQNGKTSGDSKTVLLSLANAMRLLYKWVPCIVDHTTLGYFFFGVVLWYVYFCYLIVNIVYILYVI